MLTGQPRHVAARRAGQALLVAVLLMMVILLTGILFVALVTYNQQQSARSVDVNAAQGLAEAGIRWCNENLVNSPQGADWRPPFRPFISATAYDPDDRNTWPVPPVMDTDGNAYGVYGPDGLSNTEQDYYKDFQLARGWHGLVDAVTGEYLRYGFYRIPDVNSTPQDVTLPTEAGHIAGKGHMLVRVTYNPDPPYEDRLSDARVRGPDEMSAYIKIESIGVVDDDMPVFRKLVAYKPIGLTDHVLFVTDKDRTGRSAKLGFNPRLHMHNDADVHWLGQEWHGPMRFNPRLELTGEHQSTRIRLTPQPTEAVLEVPGINPLVVTGGYLRMDRLEAAGGITEPARPPLHSAAVYERDEAGALTPLGYVSTTGDTLGGLVLDGVQGTDAQGHSRHTRRLNPPRLFEGGAADRYRALTRDSGDIEGDFNLGAYGFGRGIYIDNRDDRQFVRADGSSDIRALMNEWMQVFHAGSHTAQDSGWNETYTTYTAPGVEITLFPSENAALDFGQLSATDTPSNQPGTVWWPGHVIGEPGIRITRHDRTWLVHNPVTDAMEDAGEYTMFVDYPEYPNQVIFAEGNVRVRGALPPLDANSPNTYRDYNLTIVSGGTIYIDGQILSPQDMVGRDVGSGDEPSGGVIPDEYNTKVALLARDCVVLNPTRIVPQLTSGMVPAEPDDPFNPRRDEQHWVLSPEVSGAAYSTWTFGEPRAGSNRVSMVVQHTAVDPGPAAIRMHVFRGGVPMQWNPFNFVGGIWEPDKFYFVQPGLAPSPHPNVETTLTPDWSRPLSAANPVVPWDISGYLDFTPGVLNAVAISHADPALGWMGGGPTEYWLKRWKVHETTAGGEAIGAVHAKVNALIYAENGCWFVIPGDYFDPRQDGDDARHFRRYNYDICVRGAITENFRAEPDMVREWSDKWAWPIPGGGWATIRYEFDESLRDNRDPRDLRISTLSGSERFTTSTSTRLPGSNGVSASPKSNLPKLPLLPVSPDLIFFGEGM